ncbi:MAG: DUF4386 domain-containing protein [bacterium]|nr:DUF4386 domain-containing protein [bacterium]
MNSTKKKARFAGVLYLLLAITGIVSLLYVPGKLIVNGDAAATVSNIVSSETLFRTGITVGLIANIVFALLALALYRLFREIDKSLSMLMVALVLISVSASFANACSEIAALIIIEDPEFLSTFDKPQLDSLAYLFIRIHSWGLQAIQVFWGLWLFPFGILVWKSRFIPKIIGASLFVAGTAYIISFITFYLLPQLASSLSTLLMIMEAGELPVILWLLVVGAKEDI